METTHWTVVLEARDGDSDERRNSLEILCRTYWMPLYAFVRRRGHGPEEAADLTQEFFARFIERNFLNNVAKEKGRFRSFLLASLNHFITNEWHKQNAQKRGGGKSFLSIDVPEAESKLKIAGSVRTPEDIFRRRWAISVLERAMERLREENSRGRSAERFELLKGYLSAGTDRTPYAELAASSGLTASALKVTVHRLRKRFGEIIRDEVGQTVKEESEIEAELEELMNSLSA